MLRTASFKLSDSQGVNELLDQYRLAPGAGIFVSNGEIMISYEDGLPMNKAPQIIEIRENQNKLRSELAIIKHSNKVLDHLIADAQSRVDIAHANYDAATANPVRKECEAKLKETESARGQVLNQQKMNEHEIVRINLNLYLYDEEVKKLEAE